MCNSLEAIYLFISLSYTKYKYIYINIYKIHINVYFLNAILNITEIPCIGFWIIHDHINHNFQNIIR